MKQKALKLPDGGSIRLAIPMEYELGASAPVPVPPNVKKWSALGMAVFGGLFIYLAMKAMRMRRE